MLTSSVTCDVISFFVTNKRQKKMKSWWNSKYWRRKPSYLLSDMINFTEIFRKDVTYDNIKSHKKPGLHALSRKCISGKTTGEGGGSSWPPSLLKVKDLSCSLLVWLLLIFALQNIQVKGQYLNCDSIKDLKIIIILFLQ